MKSGEKKKNMRNREKKLPIISVSAAEIVRWPKGTGRLASCGWLAGWLSPGILIYCASSYIHALCAAVQSICLHACLHEHENELEHEHIFTTPRGRKGCVEARARAMMN